ncbi:MAG: sialate O-acetylesterase [Tepidisphaeraceae bacterium]
MVRDAIKKVSTTVPNVGYADSTGLTDKGDHVHFNAESQKEFGARFAKAMQSLK